MGQGHIRRCPAAVCHTLTKNARNTSSGAPHSASTKARIQSLLLHCSNCCRKTESLVPLLQLLHQSVLVTICKPRHAWSRNGCGVVRFWYCTSVHAMRPQNGVWWHANVLDMLGVREKADGVSEGYNRCHGGAEGHDVYRTTTARFGVLLLVLLETSRI